MSAAAAAGRTAAMAAAGGGVWQDLSASSLGSLVPTIACLKGLHLVGVQCRSGQKHGPVDNAGASCAYFLWCQHELDVSRSLASAASPAGRVSLASLYVTTP
jgi:hypothetical protein